MPAVIAGVVRNIGRPYADGAPRLEIHVPADRADGLPLKPGARVPITLIVAGSEYQAGLRATERCDVVWICPDMLRGDGSGASLGAILSLAGISANTRVSLMTDGNRITVGRISVAGRADVVSSASPTTDARNSAPDAAASRSGDEGLPRLTVRRLTGAEEFTSDGESAGFDLLSFWQWSSSDLVVNVTRGLLAEYVVAQALGVAGEVRDPWQPFDLRTPRGLTLEVKSGSYLQSWWQRSHSQLTFSIAETTAWDPDTNAFVGSKRRQAHAYVFAVLRHRDKASLNPRELSQWEFYLLPTGVIDQHCGARKSLSMKALRAMGPRVVGYSGLAEAVKELEENMVGPS